MDLESYFYGIMEGLQFLQAVGSLIGLFGLVLGIIILIFGGRFNKAKALKIVIISTVLVLICGIYTGIQYFRL